MMRSQSYKTATKSNHSQYFSHCICSLIDRHRMVNEALSDVMPHALSIVAKTEEQWKKMVEDGRAAVEGSPQCRGGFGK